jgi:hypothetical protein
MRLLSKGTVNRPEIVYNFSGTCINTGDSGAEGGT